VTRRNNNDQGIVFLASLMAGLLVIGLAWHFAARDLLPPGERLDMVALLREAWGYRDNFGAYMAWRWPPMITAGYPLAFTAAVLPGVLVYGGIIWLLRHSWWSPIQAFLSWLAGAAIGYGFMTLVPMPNALLQAFVMPGLALLAGGLVPLFLAPVKEDAPVRGTHIKVANGNSQTAIDKAIKTGTVVLAGVVLDRAAETEHVLNIGTTGSGKSVAQQTLMFTALSRGDRHIVADPDGSAMSLFYREGDVILNQEDDRSAWWDMLAEIKGRLDYRLMAEALVPQPREDRVSEWVTYAQEILSTCLETWHVNQLGSSEAFFRVMATADKEKLAQLCEGTAAHRYFETGNEKMLGSIMGTLAPALGSMRLLANPTGPAFSIRHWIREGKGSLWMPYQANQIPALRGLISCWMGLAISESLSLPESRVRRLWFHVDELDALGRIQGLKDALARLRKVGGCVVLGLQSISQVRGTYGDADANTIVENCNNKLILRCNASEGGGTARFASEVIGDRVVERDETTTSSSQGKNASTSTTRAVREHREPAVLASEIMQLERWTGYLKIATQRPWLKVAYKPVDFPKKVPAFVPVDRPMPYAAD
jgi:type IV secretory pathway TraG/TraD family ATPase VirD4